MAAKVCKIIQEWNHHPSGIALLTFLNSATDEPQSRAHKYLRDRTSEAARFAYVASSRPKHVLIWAVKKLKAEDRLVLEGLGFELP